MIIEQTYHFFLPKEVFIREDGEITSRIKKFGWLRGEDEILRNVKT